MAIQALTSRPTGTTLVAMRGLPSSSGYGQAAARRRPVAVFSGSDLPIPDCPPLRLTFSLTAVAPAVFVGSAARIIPALLAVPIQRDLNWPEPDVTWPIAISI